MGLNAQNENRRIWDSPYGEDRFVIGFNMDRWMEVPDGVEQRDVSLGFNGHIMYDYQLGKSIMSFAWGYGISSHNVHHNAFFLKDSTGYQNLVPFEDDYDLKKNKHSVTFIEAPIELRLRTHGENKFKLYVGAKAGYLVNYHWKTIDDDGKRKFYKLDDINKIRYGLTGKIGFNMFSISAFYSLSPFIKEGKGDELVPFTVGLTLFLL